MLKIPTILLLIFGSIYAQAPDEEPTSPAVKARTSQEPWEEVLEQFVKTYKKAGGEISEEILSDLERETKKAWDESRKLLHAFNKNIAKCEGSVFETEASSKFLEKTLHVIGMTEGSKDKAPYVLLKKLLVFIPSGWVDGTMSEVVNFVRLATFLDVLYDPKLTRTMTPFKKSIESCCYDLMKATIQNELNQAFAKREEGRMKIGREFFDCIPPKNREALGNAECEKLGN